MKRREDERGQTSPRWPALDRASRDRSELPRHSAESSPRTGGAATERATLKDAAREYERMLCGPELRALHPSDLASLHAAHLRMLKIIQDAEEHAWHRAASAGISRALQPDGLR